MSAQRLRTALLVAAVALAPCLSPAAQAAPRQGDANGMFVATPLPATALPVPPLPEPPPTFEAAPIPNLDVEGPRNPQAARSRAEIEPNLFTQKEERRGDGFVQGSVGRYEADRRQRVTPGVNLRVPLQ
jgi:hypothetical protein